MLLVLSLHAGTSLRFIELENRPLMGERMSSHQDGLGSVVAVTDATGNATGTARYTAWGAVARKTGGIPQYGYTGREP